MEGAVEDEKKPFDAETAPEEEIQPDPDEQLMLDQGNGRVWLVKVPKFLLERWSSIDVEDVHLASIRVYEIPGGKPRVILFLPPVQDPSKPNEPKPQDPRRPVFDLNNSYIAAATSTGPEPDAYELDFVNDNVENQVVVAERPKDPSLSVSTAAAATTTNSRARTTILTGRIKHECNLRPALSTSYRRQMKERVRKYNTPQRQIRMIEDAGLTGGRGGINRLSSGVGGGSAFGDLVKTKAKPAKGTFERMARMANDKLLDLLFGLFKEQPRWSIRPLREKTQQPEVYLKETLQKIAFLHKSGEHNGLWELLDVYKDEQLMKAENVPGPSTPGDIKMDEDYDGVDEDEDEDEDMEEVS